MDNEMEMNAVDAQQAINILLTLEHACFDDDAIGASVTLMHAIEYVMDHTDIDIDA